MYINDYDFPVGFAFIKKSHDSKNLDLLDLTDITNLLANFANIERVIVSPCLGLCMSGGGILPSLRLRYLRILYRVVRRMAYLGKSTVVPDVSVVREAVADETEPALLDVLFDGVERLLLGDLHFGIGPPRDLDDHIKDAKLLIGVEGNVMEGRDN
jgi:hypothetical protein